MTREKAEYVQAFKVVGGVVAEQLTLDDVIRAITAYERSLPEPVTALDHYLSGEASALSAEAQVGLVIFDQAGCTSCHTLNTQSAPLTDNAFHDSSVGLREIGSALSSAATETAHLSLQERLARVANDPNVAALGRFVITLNAKDIGAFRTPSLRNVARTAPYMHDGSIATLDEAIERELYYRGLKQGYPVNLSLDERRKLRLFLESASVPVSTSVVDAQLKRTAAASLQLSHETR